MVRSMDTTQVKTGWIPDLPDIRDSLYQAVFKTAASIKFPMRGWCWRRKPSYPEVVDLRTLVKWPSIYNQGSLSSCTAQAIAAVLAYLEAKEGAEMTPLSRLFIWYNTRLFKNQDMGTSIRATVKSVAKLGVCEETQWEYVESQFAQQPPPPAYASAIKRKDIKYARLLSLDDMIHCLATGFPFVFGMSLYEPFEDFSGDSVPMPTGKEKYLGGHALVAVGYDLKTKRFLIRNSWGVGYKSSGYFWLDFDALSSPLISTDFWTIQFIPKVQSEPNK